jgi:hypothetical protein
MIEIRNAELLTDVFGHWPDFHDAEVLGFRLEMADYREPRLEIDFEIFEMSSEIDEDGYFRDRHRVRATLAFDRVANLLVDGVYVQNVVFGMHFDPARPSDYDEVLGPTDARASRRHHVWWSGHLGMTADFLCDDVSVVRVALPADQAH